LPRRRGAGALAAPGHRAERLGLAQGAGRCRPSRPGRQISRRARLDRPQGPQIQLTGEFRPRKSKLNQGKPRKNAWISSDSFVRIGAFQGVTANPNKKIFSGFDSPLGLCAKCLRRALLSSSGEVAASRRLDSVSANTYNTFFCLCQEKDLEVLVATGRQIIFEQVTRERRSPASSRKIQSPV
jgi:hypothetical protein